MNHLFLNKLTLWLIIQGVKGVLVFLRVLFWQNILCVIKIVHRLSIIIRPISNSVRWILKRKLWTFVRSQDGDRRFKLNVLAQGTAGNYVA